MEILPVKFKKAVPGNQLAAFFFFFPPPEVEYLYY